MLDTWKDGVVALGIVLSVPVPLPVIVPTGEGARKRDRELLGERVAEGLCAVIVMVYSTCPEASVFVVLFSIATLFGYPKKGVPLIVTLQDLDALDMILPAEPEMSCRLQLIVV